MIINNLGEIMNFQFRAGKVDDRVPVHDLVKNLTSKVYGDKGYIKQELFEELIKKGIELMTKIKQYAKCVDVLVGHNHVKKTLIETVIDELKNIIQIEHTRIEAKLIFLLILLHGIRAYALKNKKPTVDIIQNNDF